MSVPTDNIGIARRVIEGDRAALATLDSEGWPFVSLVLVATDTDGLPLLLLSDLAEHTKNIAADSRASLLFDGTLGMADPLAGPRLTLMGRIEAAPQADALARYLARHPGAAAWARLRDFRLYRLVPTRGHLVAGFGRIAWIDAAALFSAAN